MALGRFQDDGHANQIDFCPQDGFSAHKWHLKGSQMDNVRDAIVGHHFIKSIEVGDVARDKIDPGHRCIVHNKLPAVTAAAMPIVRSAIVR
jgi:hypothetical protein